MDDSTFKGGAGLSVLGEGGGEGLLDLECASSSLVLCTVCFGLISLIHLRLILSDTTYMHGYKATQTL